MNSRVEACAGKVASANEVQADSGLGDPCEGPQMSDEEWLRAQIRQPVKKPVGLKLDDDILTWFKSQGRGYQTRINAVLRRYVEAQRKAG